MLMLYNLFDFHAEATSEKPFSIALAFLNVYDKEQAWNVYHIDVNAWEGQYYSNAAMLRYT